MTFRLTGFALFVFILLGQSAALLGATVTNFALGIWAYEKAGNVSDYTWIAVASTLPGIFIGPLLGVFVDRWRRKPTLVMAQVGNAMVLAAVTLLYFQDRLSVLNIIFIVPFSSIFATVLQISFMSTISLMVGKDKLNQANGLIGLVFGLIQLGGPLLGGIALDHFDLADILAANLVAYVIAISVLLLSRIPDPQAKPLSNTGSSVLLELREGFRYLSALPGLMGGLWVFTCVWFSVSAIQVLFVPLVLGLGTKTDLGLIQTCGGFGLLLGGLVMVAWKGPSRLAYGIAFPTLVISFAFILMPLTTSVQWLSILSLAVMATVPVANAASQTLWQRKIDPAFQGRVFALRNTIMKAAQPLAFVASGFLADNFFEPFMQPGGLWADSAGVWWGVGQGRGAALLISAFGVVCLAFALIGLFTRTIRRADLDLPDYEKPTDEAKQSS